MKRSIKSVLTASMAALCVMGMGMSVNAYELNPEVKDFYQFTTDDLIVKNYETWPQIKNIPIAV